MAKGDDPTIWRVDDALWAELQPLLVVDKPRKKPGRPRRADRPIFDGLIWIGRSGGRGRRCRMEFGPKSTVHDRFQEWVAHGCFAPAWARFLAAYDDEVGIDWQWQVADGCLRSRPRSARGAVRRKRPGATPPTAGNVAPSGTC